MNKVTWSVLNSFCGPAHVSVDVETLIEKLYLSPFAGSWFEDTFRSLVTALNPKLADLITLSGIRDQ